MQQPQYPQQAAYPQQQQQYPQGQPGVTQPAQYVAPQAPVNVVYQRASNTGPKIYEKYNGSAARILGIIMVVAGFLCIVFNAVGIAMQTQRTQDGYYHSSDYSSSYSSDYYYYQPNGGFYSGTGFWSSVFLFITGGLTIGAAGSKTNCLIVGSMVMSIISAVIAGFGLLINSSIVIGVEENGYFSLSNGFVSYPDDRIRQTSLAMGVLLLLLGFLVAAVTIAASAFACSAVCCGKSRRDTTTAHVVTTTTQYVTSPQPAQTFPPTTASYPQAQAGYPQAQPGYPQAQPGYPQAQAGYPQAQAGYPQAQQAPGYPQGQAYNPGFQPGVGQAPQPGQEKVAEPPAYDSLQYDQ